MPVYSSRMVTPCTLSPDTHPPHRRLTVHPHPNPGTVPDTPAFCIARAHNFVTVTHRLREAHRKQAKLPPRLPTSARDYTRVSFAATVPIAILAYECASEEPSCIHPFPTAATRPPIRSLDFTTATSLYPPTFYSAVAHLTPPPPPTPIALDTHDDHVRHDASDHCQ